MLCHASHAFVHTTALCSGVRTPTEGSGDEDNGWVPGRICSGDWLPIVGPRGVELLILDRGERICALWGSTILSKLFIAAMET